MDRSRTVLIVDDDEETRHVLRLLFETEQFEVVGEAGDGEKAIQLAVSHRPGFVVLDQVMPVMSGEEAAGALREAVPESRIIAFSAVLDHKPTWADAFLNKERISEVAPLLTNLL